MTDPTLVELSRWQFAITALYHFLFVPLMLGLSILVAIMESVFVMTGRSVWRRFPFLLPSSAEPSSSLTVWVASSSRRTLLLMLIIIAVCLPVVIAYTAWVYRVMRGPVTVAQVDGHSDTAY